MVIAAIIMSVGVIVELGAILRAPMGYQDQTGFHVGIPDADDEESQS